jgi:DNA-binding SARP family transcriptional activator/tetratricopeptide (TPR) repeat protein
MNCGIFSVSHLLQDGLMADLVFAEPRDAVRFGLLGPLQVVDGAGAPRAVPAGKQRVVLAALLLSTGRMVSAADLAEALWDASPSPNAPAVMRTYVMRLRRALGPAGARIVGRPPGWAVELHGPEELDLAEVDCLWRAARAAGEAGQCRQVSLLLARALSLWRGEPLVDVPSAALARREAGRLAELRLQITEARIDADLRLGRHGELVPELWRLAAEHPLREHIRAQLMLACYRCGHQAAALEVYRDARGTLADELGVEPGRELHEMHQRILAADPELTAGAPAKVAVRRPENDYPHQVEPEQAVPCELPAAVPHFTGRAAELNRLTELAGADGTAAILVVSGMAGVGKTALAVRWGHQVASRFPDGQLHVNLRGFDPSRRPVPPAEAIRGFLEALGAPVDRIPASLDARSGLYRSLLLGKRLLIVLDNARDAEQVRRLLPGHRGCLVVVTSRSQMTRLAAAEGAHTVTLGTLTGAEARELLALRLGVARLGAEPEATAEMIELCSGLPLALVIVAARVSARPGGRLGAFVQELTDARRRLDPLDTEDGPAGMRAVFCWALENLPALAARMFGLLGLHPGADITIPAAASLAGIPPSRARWALSELAEANLITEDAPGRFDLHDLLRGYAAEQALGIGSDGTPGEAVGRVLDHSLHPAHAAGLLLSPSPQPVTRRVSRSSEHAPLTGHAEGTEPAHTWRPVSQLPAASADFTGQAAAESRRLIAAIAADVPVPRLLPAAVSHFVGRTDVLKILNEFAGNAARHSEAVLIAAIGGLAGIGKTALAVHWAHQVADQFPGGQLYVDLRGFGPRGSPVTSAEAIRGFLDALGVPAAQMPAGLDARMARYRSLLAGKRVLVVLDNARDATQVRPLLPGSPGCLVVVTSRNQLDGLAASTGARLLALGVLSEADSSELLAAIVGSERAGAEPDAVAEIAGLCGRLPLALAIAAARTAARPGLPLAALAAEFRDARDRLDALDAGDPATSVRAVFSWSSDQLTGSEARLFRLLGVHPGPDITAPAAASLAGTGLARARRDLAELARACLVTEHDPGRYGMHDLLRAYASEQARACHTDAARRAAAGRVLDHYLHTARAACVLLNPLREQQITLPAPQPGVAPEHLADGQHALAWFEAEHRVLLAAAGLAGRDGFDACAWQLPWAMAEFLDRRGYWDEQSDIERAGLAAAERLGDKAGQAVARRLLAYSCARRGDNEQARAWLAPCLELYRQLGDRDGQARVRQSLSYVANQQGNYADAIGHDQQALVLFRATGHRVGQAAALNNIGWNHALLGDLEQARAFCQQALALHRELASPGEPHTWDTLGYIEHQLGRYGEAANCYQNALAIFREQRYRFYQAHTLTHLGDTHHAADDRRQARQAWQQALDILDDLRHPDADQVRAKLR